MTIKHKIWSFPTFPISKQLFTTSGAAFEGGMTLGGVRMTSPEPGGRSSLMIQPSLQINEWEYPLSSWLMSKINGDIFRVRLAPTPQVASPRSGGVPWGAGGIYPDSLWSNQQNWSGDAIAQFKIDTLEGSNVVQLDMSVLGRILKAGHAIGHDDHCYMIDEIEYSNSNNRAMIVINPPSRKHISVNDICNLRPFFLGTIANGDEMRNTYDAENNGLIQIGMIKFTEAIV